MMLLLQIRHGSTGWVRVSVNPPTRFKKQNWEKHFKRKFMWGYVGRPCTYHGPRHFCIYKAERGKDGKERKEFLI